jgi:hypothetical protein
MIVEEQISIVEEQIAARQQRARKTIEAILTGPVGQAYGDYVVKSASGRELAAPSIASSISARGLRFPFSMATP